MRKAKTALVATGIAMSIFFHLFQVNLNACSTLKLQHGDELLYAHNLNEGDIGVPGLIFINKRGVFKLGRTWSELSTPNGANPSSHTWISRYGSVTFNCFGRDLPDGGMNEAGLYIWEMNDDPEYPKNKELPRLNQMMWMQYILDNFSTTREAVQCAYDIELEGWGWHFFIGDANGNTAAVNFKDGKVVVHTGDQMPVPGLFNTPYKRELELLRYYEGFGGLYPIDLDDPEVTRFAKTAKMLRDYVPSSNVLSDAFNMLDTITVYDVPEWSVVFDVRKGLVSFRTRINPEIKHFSMADIDFSNNLPVSILNINIQEGGEVISQFSDFSNDKMLSFIETDLVPVLPGDFFSTQGHSLEEILKRFACHTDAASTVSKQFFAGVWTDEANELTLTFETNGACVSGTASNPKDAYKLDHISMIENKLAGTFITHGRKLIEIQATFEGDTLHFGFRDTSRNPMIHMDLKRVIL